MSDPIADLVGACEALLEATQGPALELRQCSPDGLLGLIIDARALIAGALAAVRANPARAALVAELVEIARRGQELDAAAWMGQRLVELAGRLRAAPDPREAEHA